MPAELSFTRDARRYRRLRVPALGAAGRPRGGAPARGRQQPRRRDRAGAGRRFAPLLAHPGRLTPDRALGDALALRRGRGFRSIARAARRYQFTGTPAVPVTVAWGSRDRVLPPRQAERARARLPAARHVQLPGCGHVPMSDDPDLVASVILTTTAAVGSG